MGFWFKQPLVGEKRCVTTLITAAKETTRSAADQVWPPTLKIKKKCLKLIERRGEGVVHFK